MNLAEQVAANDFIRAKIINEAMPMAQPLPPQSLTGTVSTSNNQFVFQPKLAGLLCGLLIEVNATVNNAGASNASRTDFGAANVIDRIQFTDTSNYLRHNTKGYHVAMLNSAKNGTWYGGAIAPNLPSNWGNVNTVNSLASSVASGGGTAALRQFYYLPICYNPLADLRGAIYSQITNAVMQLQITLNANPGYTTGDPLNAIAGGANTSVTLTNPTIKVTQIYYDQLPRNPSNGNEPLLPYQDLSTNYMLNDTTWSQLTVNTENTFPYANARTFLSTFCIYDNAGVFNTGSDISYFALKYANSLVQWQLNPQTIFLNTRNQMGFDFNPGVYYFDHRAFPIATANYGNCDLVAYPTSVGTAAFFSVLWEQFAQNQTYKFATSLPQG